MDVPWKVILAFVGVFIAGAIFGGVFTIGVSARRGVNGPRTAGPGERPAQFQTTNPPKSEVAGPLAPKMAPTQARPGNPITPVLMNQFTRRLSGLTPPQKESLKMILGRAGEDYHRLRQENLADVTRVTERMYADVASVLTMDQRGELEKMRKQLEDRVQAEKRKRAEAAAAEAANRAGVNATPAAGAPRPNSP